MTANTSPASLSVADRARRLRELHAAPEILRVVNVWDVVSAKAVLALPETKALATAGHSIAATFGYPDGEIPLDITLDMVGRIVAAAGDVPVSADLDNGYDNPGETARRAIGVGVVGLQAGLVSPAGHTPGVVVSTCAVFTTLPVFTSDCSTV